MPGRHAWQLGDALKRGVMNGIAIGCLIALAEIYWTYSLPALFPARLYVLPESLAQHVTIALALDVTLSVVALLALTVAVWTVGPRLPLSFVRSRPDIVSDWLSMFLATAYLAICLPFTYYVTEVKEMGAAK
jgi:hypothetical protein